MKSLHSPEIRGIFLGACLSFAGMAHAACDAAPALQEAMRVHPNAETAAALGSYYATHHQFDCAVTAFRAGLKVDPKSAQLHYLTGIALVAEKRPAEAVSELQQSIGLDAQAIKPHLVLASLYEDAGQSEDSRQQWKQALAIDPRSPDALDGLSRNFMAQQDYISAVKLLHDAPRTEKLTIRLAQALGLLDYLDEAQKVLTEAMQIHRNSVPLVSAMTVVLVKSRKNDEAIKLLETTAAAHPGDMEVQRQLFQILVLTNHIDDARAMMAKLLAARPHDPQVLYLAGIVERSTGDYAHARVHLEQSVAIDPDFSNSRYNLGMVLNSLHEWQSAMENLQKAIELGATVPEVHFELAKALRGLGQNDRAQEEIKKYQDMKAADERALEADSSAAMADAELDAGKIKEALDHYRSATETAPDNPVYRFKYSVALHRSGDTAGERAQLEEAVRLNPRLAGAQNALGYLLSRGGDANGAIQHFRQAAEAAPEWEEAWINLAAELAVGGQYGDARRAATKALEIEPNNAQAKELMDQLARDPNAQQAQP